MKHASRLTAVLLCLVLCMIGVFVLSSCSPEQVDLSLGFEVDGKEHATITTSGAEAITMPKNPSKEGYTFDGWFWDKDVWEKPFTANSLLETPLSDDMTVYAKFTPVRYTVTYHANGGAHENTTAYTVEDAVALSDATKEGYTFLGWYSDEAFTAKVTEISKGTTGDLSLYAKFVATEYTVTYENTKGVENINPATYTIESETVTLAALSKAGYTFDGWFVGEDEVTEIAKGTTGNITLTAKWTLNRYTITYHNTIGAVHSNPDTYTIQDSIILLEPTLAGYIFGGWYTAADGGTKVSCIAEGTTGNKNLYAYWMDESWFAYTINAGNTSYTLTGYTGNASFLFLPERYDGLPVTGIGADVFSSHTELRNVTIPSSVTSIGLGAFWGCSGLESISLPFAGASLNGTDSKHFGYIFGASDYTHNTDYIPASLKTVVITGGTSIGLGAFSGCVNLTSITISASVTNIGSGAFHRCDSLATVNFGTNSQLMSIVGGAFRECSSLTSITIPASVTSIGSGAFYGCYSLTSVYITDLAAWCNIEFYDNDANPLYYAKNLYLNGNLVTALEIPNTVTSIKDYAFYNCTNLTSVTIPASVTSIGESAFHDCNRLTAVYITDLAAWCNIEFTPKIVGNTYYLYCHPLYYARNLYLNGKIVTALEIPNTVTSIKDYAFFVCSSITSVTIPASVTSIETSAFAACEKLIEVYNLSSLNITVGSNDYGAVGRYAKNIYTSTDAESKLFTDSNGYIFYDDGTNRYLMGYTGTDTALTLPASCKGAKYEIYKYAFYHRKDLTSVAIPANVTGIGVSAFEYCESLNAVYISNLVAWCNINFESDGVSIYNGANPLNEAGDLYLNGNLVTHLEIPNGITSIKALAFSGCTSITSVTIPASVTSIETSAFAACEKLIEVYNLSSLNITVGSSSNGWVGFWAKSVYTDAMVSNKQFTDGDGYMFYDDGTNCYLMGYTGTDTALTLPASCNGNNYEIYKYAFYDRDDITSVTIPASVTSIGSYAFYGCRSLTSITIPSGVTSIGSRAFCGCYSLTTVNFDANSQLTSIGEAAFRFCYSLTSTTIPASVTSIGDFAFDDCYSLTTIYYGGSESDWRDISIGSLFDPKFILATRYYHSANEPTTAGKWWYYDNDGKPVIWQ